MKFFVTATDTDAGKTLASASLVAALMRRGFCTGYSKPVQTGAKESASGLRASEDAEQVLGYIAPLGLGELAIHVGELFDKPCSPHLAARLEQEEIDLSSLAAGVRNFTGNLEACVTEGAGGVLVPLNERETMADLMALLDWPVLLVVPNRLGAINHALLSVAALRSSGAKIAGLVFTQTLPGGDEDILCDNKRIIEAFSGIKIVAELPYMDTGKDFEKLSCTWDPWLESLGAGQ